MPSPPLKKPYRPSLPTIPGSSYHTQPDSVKDNLEHLLGYHKQKLPMYMYKDKPEYAVNKRKGMNGNKVGLMIMLVLGVLWFTGLVPTPHLWTAETGYTSDAVKWRARRNAVKDAFVKSWDYYAEHAWGMDEFHPVRQTSRNMGCARNVPHEPCPPTGWIVVDGLDTAMMMNLTSRVVKAREWIATSLDFSKVDSHMSTFETTIRVLGGLLSAHWLSTTFPDLAPLKEDDVGTKGEDLYIEKATDLAERLLGAFNTATGIPLSSCQLNTSTGFSSHDDHGAASIAEAATVQLEMKYVSKLTGEPLFWERAEMVMAAVDATRREGNLVPIFIDPETGSFRGENIRLGSRGDSYYEYLIKQYLQTGSRESVYLDMWEEALEGIKKYLVTWSKSANLTVLAERPNGLHQGLLSKMDHLVCFLPGTIALGVTGGKTVEHAKHDLGDAWGPKQEENLVLAEELMKTCWGMNLVTPTGLAAEISYFNTDTPPRRWNTTDPNWQMPRSLPLSEDHDALWREDYDIHANDRHNLQRPETVESLFYMWRITGDIKYREWGWSIFQSFMKHAAVHDEDWKVVGYTSIGNVNVQSAGAYSSQKDTRIVAGKGSAKDNMEGFWLSETLKYLYLLFEDEVAPWNDLEKIVINTEAHFFPRFDIGAEGKVWKTGWTRKERVLEEAAPEQP